MENYAGFNCSLQMCANNTGLYSFLKFRNQDMCLFVFVREAKTLNMSAKTSCTSTRRFDMSAIISTSASP